MRFDAVRRLVRNTIAVALVVAGTQASMALAQRNVAPAPQPVPDVNGAIERWLSEPAGVLRIPVPNELRAFGALPNADRVIYLQNGEAVARIPGDGIRSDIYIFLKMHSDGSSQVTSVHGASLVPDVTRTIEHFSARSNLPPEDQEILGRLRALVRPDSDYHRWFAQHRELLMRLTAWLAANGARSTVDESGELPSIMRGLGVRHVGVDASRRHGYVPIDSIRRFGVGVVHADTPEGLNALTPSHHVWFEPLGDGWYLYRSAFIDRP